PVRRVGVAGPRHGGGAPSRRRASRPRTRVRRRRAVLRHVDRGKRESLMGKLDGKVALVSGGARGMGAAEVRRLHADGASVVAGDVLEEEGKALADSLGARVRFVHLDVTSEESWQSAVEQTEREFGRLDVLVNNAGILRFNAI